MSLRTDRLSSPIIVFDGVREIGLKEPEMLYTVAVILAILWILGIVSSYTMGGLIHLLLVLAIIVVVIKALQGRRV